MNIGVSLVVLALMGTLLGSAWSRRGDLELNGESGAMLIGVVVCAIAAVFVLWLT